MQKTNNPHSYGSGRTITYHTARLKLARCLRAHKNTFNNQNNTPSIKSLKGEQGLGLGPRTQKHSELLRDLDDHIQELAMCLVSFN
jgi:hypothetical protein